MSDLSRAPAAGALPSTAAELQHPSTFAPATLIFLIILCIFGAVIGVQLILQLGITPNTSIIGAPRRDAAGPRAGRALRPLPLNPRAEFGAERDLGGDFQGRQQPAPADRRAVPARPSRSDPADAGRRGIVDAARRLSAVPHVRHPRVPRFRHLAARGSRRPKRSAPAMPGAGAPRCSVSALLVGIAGSWLKIPMSAFGVAFIGNVWALTMFGIGLLIRGYAMPVAGIDIAKLYVPHGAMVGAGLVCAGPGGAVDRAGALWVPAMPSPRRPTTPGCAGRWGWAASATSRSRC